VTNDDLSAKQKPLAWQRRQGFQMGKSKKKVLNKSLITHPSTSDDTLQVFFFLTMFVSCFLEMN